LPRKTIDRIKAGEYIDFAELPPAKGKARPLTAATEGVIVVQAADLLQSRKLIPDLATWTQCFALYATVRIAEQPARLPELMAYMTLIARASRKYKWPAWLVYDQNFRQEAAGNSGMCWAKADPSIYTQCFTSQAGESWCGRCHSLDHSSSDCPYNRGRKRPWNGPAEDGGPHESRAVCLKYNRYNGDCQFGKSCRFQHVCSTCRGPHPAARCSKPPKKD
jgi:hypothetical protein